MSAGGRQRFLEDFSDKKIAENDSSLHILCSTEGGLPN
jgi:hypothetical protein